MIVGVPREVAEGERRVALVPELVKSCLDLGVEVLVQRGAGLGAGFPDERYEEAGAKLSETASSVLGADVVLKVQAPLPHELRALRPGAVLIAFLNPLDDPELAAALAERRVVSFAMELMPRITRAQSMDALSSQSNLAGYRAVLLAASALPKIFPMMVTAAGTIAPARVLVVGAGVAGLQAIATAKRLGAVVEAYDTRPAVKEQVESLGARFVELDLPTGDAEGAGGYARAQSEEFYRRQREQLALRVAQADVVVTTALVPGAKAPLLIEESAVRAMRPGSAIVDLAADHGGNCAFTRAGETVHVGGVQVIAGGNLASEVPTNASQMYARNLVTFFSHLVVDGELSLDWNDDITGSAVLTRDGTIANEAVRVRALGGAATA